MEKLFAFEDNQVNLATSCGDGRMPISKYNLKYNKINLKYN